MPTPMRRTLALALLAAAACRAPLPQAAAARGHGLQTIWLETLGLE
jgi:hypothetical protein